MIPKFNETVGKEMGITVTPVYQSSSDLISKVKALILAKDVDNLPDMVQVFAGAPAGEYLHALRYSVEPALPCFHDGYVLQQNRIRCCRP